MIRKTLATLSLAGLAVIGLAAPAQATDRTPCVKVINGVEIRTCAIGGTPTLASTQWNADGRNKTRVHTCTHGPINLRCAVVLPYRPIPR